MAHHKTGAVLWSVFKNLAPPMAMGCFLGAGIAGWISGFHLKIDSTCSKFVVMCSRQFGFGREEQEKIER